MTRAGSLLVGFLVVIALPAAAQNPDVFREGAPPASAPTANPVRPRPVPRSEPQIPAAGPLSVQPPVAAAAPSLPPATQLWARIRQVAQSAGVAVPLASAPPFDEVATPPQYRALLGAWGPAMWQGNPAGERLILVIQSVDAGGHVRGIVATSNGGDSWTNFTAPLEGNRFTVHFQLSYYRQGFAPTTAPLADDYWQMEPRGGGMLSGSRAGGASTIVLPRLQ